MIRRNCLATAGIFVSLAALLVGCGQDPAPNRPPVIDKLTTDTEVVSPGQQAQLNLRAGDPDTSGQGASNEAGLSAGLEATWSVDDEDWSISGDGATATVTAPDSYDKTVEVEATVTDREGASDTARIELTTGENTYPRITTATASPNPAAPGETVTLEADARDPDGDELTYSWTAPDGWALQSETGQTTELQAPDEDGASADVTLEVSDGYGGTDARTVRVETKDNAAPTISSMTAAPPQVAPGETSTITVEADDPDGDSLDYDWSAPGDWTLDGEGHEVTLQAPDSYGATANISVEITDARGHRATGRVVVSTTTNDGPQIQALTANPQQVTRGSTIDLTVDATDPNGDSLSYSWSVADSAWTLSTSGSTATLDTPDEPGVSTTVTVTVTDASGASSKASIVVSTAPNQPPSLGSVTANPSRTAPGGTVTLKAAATDPDGDQLQYSWQSPADWSLNANGTEATVTAPDVYGASADLTVAVTDGFGGRATGTVTVYTEANQPPTISGVTASPPVVDKKGTSTLSVTATDPNGDSISYSWSVPQDWSKSGSGAQITVTAPDKYGARGVVEVTADDGNGGVTKSSVAVQTQGNQAPVIFSSSATKTTLEPDEQTTLDINASDVDGDSLSYSWKLPSGWKGSSNTPSITVTAPRQYSKQVKVVAEVSDGTDTTTETFTLETVANQPPSVSSFTVKPDPVDGGQTTTATVQASDPLGDSLSYAWSVDNNDWTLSGSGASVQLKAPQKQSSTKLTVTVDDGHGLDTTQTKTVQSQVRLYSFSSHTFTTCNKSGRTGPTLSNCRSDYSTNWDDNGNYFTMNTRGIQEWTVPETATYRIKTAGAGYNGGGDASNQVGAVIRADFKLNRGDTLRILVGQMSAGRCAGSGGTFVERNGSPLIAAGGSGGQDSENHGKLAASTTTAGHDGNVGAGGTNGSGGKQSCGDSYGGGAGGGYSGDGVDNGSNYGCPGKAFVNGGVGGSNSCGNSSDHQGGFGGGGSGYCSDEPGAGGGYSGGGGGGYESGCGSTSTRYGGGGGSYIAPSGSSTSKNTGRKGHGYVTITKNP